MKIIFQSCLDLTVNRSGALTFLFLLRINIKTVITTTITEPKTDAIIIISMGIGAGGKLFFTY
jgi:hypothetical protein